jgi:hypothetical protein
MDGLVQIQLVVQGNAGAIGLVGLDTQGRVWYGELSGRASVAHSERRSGPCCRASRWLCHAPAEHSEQEWTWAAANRTMA